MVRVAVGRRRRSVVEERAAGTRTWVAEPWSHRVRLRMEGGMLVVHHLLRVLLLLLLLEMGRLLGRRVLLKFRRQSVRPDLEHPSLPVVPVEHVDRADAVLPASHEHRAVSSGSVVAAERDVCAEDGPGATEQVLHVLPPHSERQVADKQAHPRVLARPWVGERRLLVLVVALLLRV